MRRAEARDGAVASAGSLSALERSALVLPCALGAISLAFFLVFLHSSMSYGVPPWVCHSFMLASYYGGGLAVAPNRRPVFASLLALISVTPWLIAKSGVTAGAAHQGGSPDNEVFLFVVGFGFVAIVVVLVGSLVASGVRRNGVLRR